MSSGSKPVTTIGTWNRSTSGGYSSVPITLHTWPGGEEALHPAGRRLMIASIAGGTRTCETSMLKFVDAEPLGLVDRHRVGRRGRLEADAEEHHLAVRVLARDLQRVERRVDDADVAALRS